MPLASQSAPHPPSLDPNDVPRSHLFTHRLALATCCPLVCTPPPTSPRRPQEDIAFKKKQAEDKKALAAAKKGVVAGKPLKLKKK